MASKIRRNSEGQIIQCFPADVTTPAGKTYSRVWIGFNKDRFHVFEGGEKQGGRFTKKIVEITDTKVISRTEDKQNNKIETTDGQWTFKPNGWCGCGDARKNVSTVDAMRSLKLTVNSKIDEQHKKGQK